MEKLTQYKALINDLLSDYLTLCLFPTRLIETYKVADNDSGNYLLYRTGWVNGVHNYGCFLHLRLHNEKIYIEYDGTDEEQGFAGLLVAAGVPKSDIVLAYHIPSKRPYTDFALA